MKKKLDFNDIIKILDPPESTIFVISKFFKDSVFTEKEWMEELEKRKII